MHLELPSADVEVVLQFLQEKELFETLLAMEGETGVKYAATFQHLQVGMPQTFRANRRDTCSRFSLGASFAGSRPGVRGSPGLPVLWGQLILVVVCPILGQSLFHL